MDYSWLIILLCLIAASFFSGMEIAFITANKLRIELESKQGHFSSKIISAYFLYNPSRYIATMLVGNNIALVVYGIIMAGILEPVIERFTHSEISILLLQTVLSTLLILIVAEFLPKVLFRLNPNRILSILALPVLVMYIILYPIVFITIGISEFVLKRIFKIKMPAGKMAFGRIDLDNYVSQVIPMQFSNQKEVDHEVQIFQNALEFSSVKIRECMIPRTEIIALEANESIDTLKNKFIETGLSKILIYRDNIDDIIGYVHSSEMFKQPENIQSVMLPVLITPESMLAKEALSLFIQQHKSIATVVDEFGGTSGMLTIEDVMEEIFGEIEDEHDKEELEEKKISETEYIFAGRLEIDYINDKYKLNFPKSDDYETISGLIINYTGSIPELDDEIRIDNFIFTIKKVKETRIEKVRLTFSE